MNSPKLLRQDWLKQFFESSPEHIELLLSLGITDEFSYLEKESRLNRDLRISLAKFRLQHNITTNHDPCAFAKVSPPWLLELKIADLELSIRTQNVLRSQNIYTVADLSKLSSKKLLTFSNFGPLSLKDINTRIKCAFEEGPQDTSNYSESEWLERYFQIHPEEKESLLSNEITDESSYFENESVLDDEMRIKLGVFRLNYFIETNTNDICAFARASPPWLLTQNLIDLELTVRSQNVFRNNKVYTVADLSNLSYEKLLTFANFGVGSLKHTLKRLKLSLEAGPNRQYDEDLKSESLLTEVNESLSCLSEIEKQVILARLGFKDQPKTLQKVADEMGLTRERVRQIEKSGKLQWVRRSSSWQNNIIKRVRNLLENVTLPLPLAGVEAVDSWFKGVSLHVIFFERLVRMTCANELHIVKVGGVSYFSQISEAQMKATISDAINLLSSSVDQAWPKSYAKSIVYSLLPSSAREFEKLVWEQSSRWCHFTTNSNGEKVLSDYGRGAETFVRVVLRSSNQPLHYKEISKQIYSNYSKSFDVRRVHNAAASIGLLFGRGTYGLPCHIPLSKEEITLICEFVEKLICFSEVNKQWHTSEILFEIRKHSGFEMKDLDKYTLDIALHNSNTLASLGRMIWQLKGPKSSDRRGRINVHQAVVSILKESGRPLGTREIVDQLIAVRGVGEHFQIFPLEPIVRIKPGIWGLTTRDL